MARAKRKHHGNHHGNHRGNHQHKNHHHVNEPAVDANKEEIKDATQEAAEGGRQNTKQAQRSVLAAFQAFDIFGGPMARLLEHNRAVLQKMLHAMQEQSLEFVNRRLEHTGQAVESFRDCHGVSELLDVQQEWMLDFARDCAEQTKRFTEVMQEFAEDGVERLSQVSPEAMEHLGAEELRAAA